METKEKEIKQVLESLSPNERKILSFLKERSINKISEKSNLDKTSVLRALEFLSNKKILSLKQEKKQIVGLDIHGIQYKKTGLPERKLLNLLSEKKSLSLDEAKKLSKLSDNEFKAALGALKGKALINLVKGKIILQARHEEIVKKSLEEQFIESLPLELNILKDEQKFAFQNLKKRKKIIVLEEKKDFFVELTKLGEEIISQPDKFAENLIEKLTPEMIKKSSWKGKKFRRYDITSPLPKISGGKRHFVNQATEQARKIWLELGFKEMTGDLIQSSFWVFDSLFTPQDHPARDEQDTFFIDKQLELPDKKIVQEVKKAHEKGIEGSKGWQYNWEEKEAKKAVLRTHTTCLSAQTLASLKKEEMPGKFFAIGKCFRNETIDASHLFEFNQTEGIVVDKNANFKHLLGYLKAFLNKMGFEKIRFRPHFFPYTEPSVEADVYDEKTGKWVEILGAGIFRPELTSPLLGEVIPVLAWGMGFDRMVMQNYNIEDIRDLYKGDINQLRKIKF